MTSKKMYSFTMIELIVVITIIMILAGMLLPTLGKARERGRQSACAGNLNQLGIAVSMYIVDWKDYFPGSINNVFHSNLEPYTNTKHTYSEPIKPGIYFCPSDTYRAGLSNKSLKFFSYGQNCYCKWDTSCKMNRITGIRKPSRIIYLLDSRNTLPGNEGYPINFGVNTWPFLASASTGSSGDFRHAGCMNTLYADMHRGASKLLDELGSGTSHIYEY